ASAACLALATWLFVFGLLGLFLRLVHRETRAVRYLADASYWLYLAHMPVLLAFQIAVADTGWTPAAKAWIVLGASVIALFVSYHLAVRPTWVGAILNGRRYPIGFPLHSASAPRTPLTLAGRPDGGA